MSAIHCALSQLAHVSLLDINLIVYRCFYARYMNVLDGTRRRSSWTRDEDLELIDLVKKIGEGNWTAIASRMKNRADCQCLRRWNALKQ